MTTEITPTDSLVRRRRVYYLGGVDPRGVRFYHQLYKSEAAAQAAVNGCTYGVGECQKTGDFASSWNVIAQHASSADATQTRYTFLGWEDLIRELCPISLRSALAAIPGLYGRYAAQGGFSTAWVYGRRFFWLMVLPLIYLMLAVLVMGVVAGLMAWGVTRFSSNPWLAGLAALVGVGGMGTLAMWRARGMHLMWLLGAIAFVPRWGRNRPEALTARWDAFAEQIHADLAQDAVQQPPWVADEVLIVGHCGGTMAAVCVADRFLATPTAPGGPPVKLVTLGSVIPLLGVVREAHWFRAQLVRVGNSAMPWKAFSAPADPLCYPLVDPFVVCGLPAPAGVGGFQIKSSRFDQMFDQATYALTRRNAFRIHFQYLMATQLPVDNDYFTLTAGPRALVVVPQSATITSYVPPKPGGKATGRSALLGGLSPKHGRSMLNLLPAKLFTLQMGVTRIAKRALFVVNAPCTVREVMVEQAVQYPKHPFLVDILEPLVGMSVFNTNGEQWAQQRRLVDQSFVYAGLRRAFPLMRDATTELLNRLDAVADQPGSPAWDADAEMSHITADIIFRTVLSSSLGVAQAADVHDAFKRYQANAQRVMGLSALHLPTAFHRWRCRQLGTRLRQPYAALIRQRFAAIDRGATDLPEDMLSTLIQAKDPVTGYRFSEHEVVCQVGALFLAGHETSASALGWALYLLACRPELQEEVRCEIAALWGERAPEFGDTRILSLTHDVFRETLRLYPPVPFYWRQAAQSGCLRDKPVAQGDLVLVAPWVIQRHRALWERPDEFDPHRFDTECGRAAAKIAYLPFGQGPRACPGAAFATQEAVLILAQLVRRFRVEPVAGHDPQPSARLTLRSANGVQLRLTRRPV